MIRAQEVRIEKLELRGNRSISAGTLKDAIQTKSPSWYASLLFWKKPPLFDEDTFLDDLLRIEKYYHQQGFLEARVENYELSYNDQRDRVKASVRLEEGPATTVNDVRFKSADSTALPSRVQGLPKAMRLKSGKRYREEDLHLDYQRIVGEFSDRGYPFITARVKPTFYRREYSVDLEWQLDPGPFSHFGTININGNRSVSERVILRGLGFRTGQPFVQRKLAQAQNQVYRLELFQFVSLKAANLDEPSKSIPVEVRVRETNLRTLKFGVGYGTEEFIRLTGQWRHRNFLGGGRILRAQVRHSTQLLPLQLELELSQPYFLSNRNDLIVKPFFIWQDERSFEARRVGLETTFNRQLTSRTNAFVTTKIERDTVDVKVQESAASEALADLYNKSLVRVGIQRNSTDELFSPSRGSVARFVVEEAGRFLRTRFKYLKAFAEYRKFNQIKPGHIFAWRIMVGAMGPIRGSELTPVEERFFSGGSYSVRGWKRQLLGPSEASLASDSTASFVPTGGNSLIEGSLEFRNPLFGSVSSALFLDFGNVWTDWNGFDFLDLHYAVGAGLRYNTLIGPIRLDFAWKVNRQETDHGNYEIHLSIGQSF